MPQRRTRFRVHSFERLCIVAEEKQPSRCAHGSSRRVAFADLRILPGELSGGELIAQKYLLRLCSAGAAHSRGIVGASFGKFLGLQKKGAAILQRQKIKLMRGGIG